jgi:hypothetical protein
VTYIHEYLTLLIILDTGWDQLWWETLGDMWPWHQSRDLLLIIYTNRLCLLFYNHYYWSWTEFWCCTSLIECLWWSTSDAVSTLSTPLYYYIPTPLTTTRLLYLYTTTYVLYFSTTIQLYPTTIQLPTDLLTLLPHPFILLPLFYSLYFTPFILPLYFTPLFYPLYAPT